MLQFLIVMLQWLHFGHHPVRWFLLSYSLQTHLERGSLMLSVTAYCYTHPEYNLKYFAQLPGEFCSSVAILLSLPFLAVCSGVMQTFNLPYGLQLPFLPSGHKSGLGHGNCSQPSLVNRLQVSPFPTQIAQPVCRSNIDYSAHRLRSRSLNSKRTGMVRNLWLSFWLLGVLDSVLRVLLLP